MRSPSLLAACITLSSRRSGFCVGYPVASFEIGEVAFCSTYICPNICDKFAIICKCLVLPPIHSCTCISFLTRQYFYSEFLRLIRQGTRIIPPSSKLVRTTLFANQKIVSCFLRKKPGLPPAPYDQQTCWRNSIPTKNIIKNKADKTTDSIITVHKDTSILS